MTWQDPNECQRHVGRAMQCLITSICSGRSPPPTTVMAIQENMLNTSSGNFNCLVLRAVGWNPPPYFVSCSRRIQHLLRQQRVLSAAAAGDATIASPTINYQWAAGPPMGLTRISWTGAKYAGTTTDDPDRQQSDRSVTVLGLCVDRQRTAAAPRRAVVANVYVQSAPLLPAPGSLRGRMLSLTRIIRWLSGS